MQVKEKKATIEIQIIADKSMLTVSTIKKKFVDQMQKLSIDGMTQLPEKLMTLNTVGWYREAPKDSVSTFENLILKDGDHFFRVDVYIICSHIAEKLYPELWEYPRDADGKGIEDSTQRNLRYENQRKTVKAQVKKMLENVPQLFTE